MAAANFSLCFLLALARAVFGSQHISFDGASASSTYSAGSASGYPTFAAPQALAPSSGYWCSAGSHAPEEVVSWTGVLGARREVLGLKLDWAYSPGEFKILLSADGANFAEAACWRAAARSDVAYAEYVMFEAPVAVAAVTVVMRQPRAWGYFGLNSASMIALPGPSLVVSGATSPSELCLVGASDLYLTPCVAAMSAGAGQEVFVLTEDGLLTSALDSDACVTLADGDVSSKLVMSSCKDGSSAADGRNVFEVTPAGQLKLAKIGGYCVTATGELTEKDLAADASAIASSSQVQHPASSAISGDATSFWASASSSAPVDLTIGLAAASHISSIEIDWELPAKSFEVLASTGGAYQVLYSTQTNSMNKTVVVADGVSASSIQLRMKEPHPVWGAAGGEFAYGVRAVRVVGSSAAVVVQDCGEAAASEDARDKFFLVSVPEFDSSLAAGAKASAELAVKSGDRLAGLLASLVAALPTLEHCSLRKEATHVQNMQTPLLLRAGSRGSVAATVSDGAAKSLGVDGAELKSLIGQAKAVVAMVRSKM